MSTMDFWTVFKRPISVCPGFARWIMPKFVKNQKDSLCRFAALLLYCIGKLTSCWSPRSHNLARTPLSTQALKY